MAMCRDEELRAVKNKTVVLDPADMGHGDSHSSVLPATNVNATQVDNLLASFRCNILKVASLLRRCWLGRNRSNSELDGCSVWAVELRLPSEHQSSKEAGASPSIWQPDLESGF